MSKLSFRQRFNFVIALVGLLGFSMMSSPTTLAAGTLNPQPNAASFAKLGPLAAVHSFSFSTLALQTLPQISGKWHLTKVQVFGGAASGSYALSPDGVTFSNFAVAGTGFAQYDVDWLVPGTNIPTGIQTTKGTAPAQITITFSSTSLGGPNIYQYRSIFITTTQGAANTSLLALAAATFDQTPSIPIGIAAFTSAGNAQVAFPSQGGLQSLYGCQIDVSVSNDTAPYIHPAPLIPSGQSIVISILNSAAATLHIWVFYQPSR